MAVRNFYISADVDGRETMIGSGPRNKEGGMTIRITQRDEAGIRTAFNIKSFVTAEGKLMTRVFDGSGNTVGELITNR